MSNTAAALRVEAARENVNTEIVPALLEAFAGKVESIAPTNDQIPQVFAEAGSLLEIAQWLKAKGFNVLVDMSAADYYPKRDPRFDVVYHFRQFPALGMIRVRVKLGEKDAVVPSLAGVWHMANVAEREVYDQFGIEFKGHPNLKRILNPDDWVGFPMRRDYPLRGPRGLINLEMPADTGRYHAFVDDEEGK